MTGPHSETESPDTRPISVAELLARNGTIGAPAVGRRRRRRRGDSDAVTVAELTGEIPIIRDDHRDEPGPRQPAGGGCRAACPQPPVAERVPNPQPDQPDLPNPSPSRTGVEAQAPYWAEPEPRWPKSSPQARRPSGPERSAYPRPLRAAAAASRRGRSGFGCRDT